MEKESEEDPRRHGDDQLNDEGERVELWRSGKTSEGQATMAFTGNDLMLGHARRGLSK